MNNTKRKLLPIPVTIVRSSGDWKPEPCGLTHEQIRAIIMEQLG